MMATIDKELAFEIIAANGYFLDDPRVVRVVKYQNQFGGESYAVIYTGEDRDRYHKSPACRDVVIVWEAKS